MTRVIKYAGSKLFLVDKIDEIIYKTQYKDYIYIEPFVGSGAIYFNIGNGLFLNYPKKYVINDIDENIIGMFNWIKNNTYESYNSITEEIKNNFGDIKESKESYYNFRNWYNTLQSDNKYGYLIHLANSCINSMLRFGPNGVNTSFGNSHYIMDNSAYNNANKRLNDNTEIYNLNYKDVLNMYYGDKASKVVFLDPPYEDNPMSYQHSFDRRDFIEYVKDFCINTPNTCIIYTDTSNEESDELLDYGFTKHKIRDMLNISPNRKTEVKTIEVMYLCNYKGEKK